MCSRQAPGCRCIRSRTTPTSLTAARNEMSRGCERALDALRGSRVGREVVFGFFAGSLSTIFFQKQHDFCERFRRQPDLPQALKRVIVGFGLELAWNTPLEKRPWGAWSQGWGSTPRGEKAGGRGKRACGLQRHSQTVTVAH